MDPDAAIEFLGFVEERHKVWVARQAGAPRPWTVDPIIATRKFTNVFRVLDHGSQYVLSDLIDPELSVRDQLARLFLYRHTGRVEVWEAMDLMVGLPTMDNLDDCLEAMKAYRGETRQIFQAQKKHTGGRGYGHQKRVGQRPVFTSAYLVFPQSAERGTDKLESIFALTRRVIDEIAPAFEKTTMRQQFDLLRGNKGVADFMSMQVLTDWGYTPQCGEDRENEFVVPGPGARKGAAELGMDADAAVRWAWEAVRSMDSPPQLGDRLPSLMDVQNCLCEFSKYARFMGKPTTSPYVPSHPGPQPVPLLPGSW